MDATSVSQMLPDRDILAREVCSVLGDGGTMDHARAAVAWAMRRFGPLLEAPAARAERVRPGVLVPTNTELVLADLVDVKGAAGIVGTTRANIMRWSNGQGRTDFPDPVLVLDCGKHWSGATLRKWVADVFPVDQAQDLQEAGKTR